jgi:hypothetical protein
MLVFDRESWKNHRSWCAGTLIATSAALVWYVVYGASSGDWIWPGGASPPGFAFGLLGGVIILFEMLLWPRKSLWRGWRLLPTKTWMVAHLWLGLLSLPLLLLHGSFHFAPSASTLAAVLMWLLVAVVASGIFGLFVQNVVPRLMLEQVPAETIYSQIGHVLAQYRTDAERLVSLSCGRPQSLSQRDGESAEAPVPVAGDAPSFVSVGTVRQVGRVQGKVIQVGLEAGWVAGSEPLLVFYQDHIKPYLSARTGKRLSLGSRKEAEALFAALKNRVGPEARSVVDHLADLCDQRRQFDLQARLHLWLHSWLVAHVALSVGLVVLMVIHAILALKYL